MVLLDRGTIGRALERLDHELGRRGVRADLHVVGGAVLCLVHETREATKDVDAWFTEPSEVRRAAAAVATEMGLPGGWLNDAAKGYVPESAGFESWAEWPNLSVSVADASTPLAMKVAASRTLEDAEDIRFLARHLNLETSQAVLEVVLSYYPEERLPVRARLLLEEMFS
jgi:hypothetical protein